MKENVHAYLKQESLSIAYKQSIWMNKPKQLIRFEHLLMESKIVQFLFDAVSCFCSCFTV